MTKILITVVLLCATRVAYGQVCGVDPETDVPGGSSASSHSSDPCPTGGHISPLQGATPTLFQQLPHGSFLALQSAGWDFAVLDRLGSLICILRFVEEDDLEVLKLPVEEVKNIVPSALPNDITITPQDKKSTTTRQQILASTMSHVRNGICSSEGCASVKAKSITEGIKVPSTDKRSQS